MWGSNYAGELGIGEAPVTYLSPVRVIDSGVRSVSLGSSFTAAVMDDGSLWMWGADSHGCLGNGEADVNVALSPIRVIDSGVESVSVGMSHSAVIMEDGSLWAWGYNYYGQVGNGSTVDQHSPVQIISSGVREVDLGGSSTAAIMDDGSLWMWGEIVSSSDRKTDSPQKMIDAGVEGVSQGSWLHAGVIVDSSLWMYGADFWGELGNGSEDHDGFVKGITFGASVDPDPSDPSGDDALPADSAMTQLTACLLSGFNVGAGYEGKTVRDYLDSGAFVNRAIWSGSKETYEDLFTQVLGEYEIVSSRLFSYRGAPHIALKHPASGDVIIAFAEGGPELLESIGVSTYFNDAAEILAEVEVECPSSTIYLTGADAGGMAAAYLSSATNWKTTTFNSPAISATLLTTMTQSATLSKANGFRGVDDTKCVNYYTEGLGDNLGYSNGIAVSIEVDPNPLGNRRDLTSLFRSVDGGFKLCSSTMSVPGEMQLFGIKSEDSKFEHLEDVYTSFMISSTKYRLTHDLSEYIIIPSVSTIGDIKTIISLGTTGHDSRRVGLFNGEEKLDLIHHQVNLTGNASSDLMEGGNTSDVFVMGEGSATLSGRAGSDLYYIGDGAQVAIHDTGATDGNNLADLFRSSFELIVAHDLFAVPDFAESLGAVLSHTNRDAIVFTNCSFDDMEVSYNNAGNYFIIQAGTSRVTVPNRGQDFYIVDASGQTVADGMMLNDLFALKKGVAKSSVSLMAEDPSDFSLVFHSKCNNARWGRPMAP